MQMPTMPNLILDTTRYASEKKAGFWETSVCTPNSTTSTMSASLAPDVASDVGSDSLSADSEIKFKTENTPSPPLQCEPESSGSPAPQVGRRKPLGARSPSEEHKRIRVNERSKTGCLTCRKRKKKCDETKPYCTSCTMPDVVRQLIMNRQQLHQDKLRAYKRYRVNLELTLIGMRGLSLAEAVESQETWEPPQDGR